MARGQTGKRAFGRGCCTKPAKQIVKAMAADGKMDKDIQLMGAGAAMKKVSQRRGDEKKGIFRWEAEGRGSFVLYQYHL